MADIRVALIGYGLGGRSFHAPMIMAAPGMKLTHVVSANADRASQARAEIPGVIIVDNANELWRRSDEIDLVVISTPNRTHVPLALAAVDTKLPLVVDKPLAATSADAQRVVTAAREAGVFLTVYQNRRYDGDFRTLRNLLAQNALGQVHRFESRFERWRPAPKPGWRESSAPEDAGGLLYDLGSHLIDQALALFGGVTSVYAEVRALRANVTVDDDVFLALTHANGVQSHLWTTMLAAEQGARLRVLGNRAMYVKWGMDPQEAALRDGAKPRSPGWGVESEAHWGTLITGDGSRAVQTERGDYTDFYVEAARAIREGGPPPVKPEDAIATLRVVEAAQQSARTGNTCPLTA
jgi:scyllo-inositol 2-dehydrogenase (NADP+)